MNNHEFGNFGFEFHKMLLTDLFPAMQVCHIIWNIIKFQFSALNIKFRTHTRSLKTAYFNIGYRAEYGMHFDGHCLVCNIHLEATIIERNFHMKRCYFFALFLIIFGNPIFLYCIIVCTFCTQTDLGFWIIFVY